MDEKNSTYDLIIIGAGPTGINIGIEAQKAKLNFLILEKGMLVNSIYNFPTNMTFFSTSVNLEIGNIPFISHSDKPTRKEALEYYRRILDNYKLPVQYKSKVDNIEIEKDEFIVNANSQKLKSKHVAIATGFYDNPKLLNIKGESLPKVKHYYDDAHPYIGMNLVIVGGANSACDVALETWQKGANVTMVVRDQQLYQKVKYWILPNIENRIKEGSIKAYFNAELSEIRASEVDINTKEGQVTIDNDYVLAMTGYTPDFSLMTSLGVTLNGENRIPEFNEDSLESNVRGLYLAGVINAGNQTSKLFIENTRDHGMKIVNSILQKRIDTNS